MLISRPCQYYPKDQPSWLESLFGVGHRYDWEGIVVWLSEESTDATLLGVAASYHGDFVTSTDPDLSGDHPLIKYYSAYSVLDHSLGFTSTVGGTQPLIAWDSMSTVVQDALADKDWGGKSNSLFFSPVFLLLIFGANRITDANVLFKDGNFESNLAEAVL